MNTRGMSTIGLILKPEITFLMINLNILIKNFKDWCDTVVCVRMRLACQWLISQQSFDYGVLLLIAVNCITLAMERPGIPGHSMVGQHTVFTPHGLWSTNLVISKCWLSCNKDSGLILWWYQWGRNSVWHKWPAKEHSQQQNWVYILKTSAHINTHTYKEILCFVLCIITDCISRQNCT